jgi:serine/threonine protein kinase
VNDLPTILEEALALPEHDRKDYLDRVCRGNSALRERIQGMIAAATGANAFFNEEPATVADNFEGPGTVIGRYKLLQKIGEGGMGVVYMAEQTSPVVRKVALKII